MDLPRAECCRWGNCTHAENGMVMYIGEAVKEPKRIPKEFKRVFGDIEGVKRVARGEA